MALRARRVSLAVRRRAAGGVVVVVVGAGVPGEGGRLLAPVASFQA